jgi:hypothetical protein
MLDTKRDLIIFQKKGGGEGNTDGITRQQILQTDHIIYVIEVSDY